MNKLTPLRTKIFLTFFGVISAMVLTEAFLQIGALIQWRQTRVDFLGKTKNTFTVLCLGDSTTYGYGSRDRKHLGYPGQLERILQQENPDRMVKIQTFAITGINSSRLLHKFTKPLLKCRPDLVIIMIGINDTYNFNESNVADIYQGNLLQREFLRLEMVLENLRLYRLLKLTILTSMSKIRNPMIISDDESTSKYSIDLSFTKAVNLVLEHNILEMFRITNDYNCHVLFMKYQRPGFGNIEKTLNKIYDKYKIPFIDNETVFKEAAKRGEHVIEEDGFHPNDWGYLLMAKNIYNSLIAFGITQGKPLNVFTLDDAEIKMLNNTREFN